MSRASPVLHPIGFLLGNVVLISTYEMGRQPFGLASPAAWLKAAGANVSIQDLAVSHFDPAPIRRADLVGFYVPMHTATRLADGVLRRVRELNGDAHVCFYGLYAAVNESYLRKAGADSIIGGEFEGPMVDLYRSLDNGAGSSAPDGISSIFLGRQRFKVPDRTDMAPLDAYAKIEVRPGVTRTTGYTEATRGCKHLCRHCPVVPVYEGRFVVVQPDVVIEDIRRQVAAGARHITFGDPDFFNGPAHARRVVRKLHAAHPGVTYDVTIKVEHLTRHADLIPVLRDTGCILVTSAIESFDDLVLDKLDKRHSSDDLDRALIALRDAGLSLNATFVPFTPWTTLRGYANFIEQVAVRGLIDNVAPIQYAIRLLIPSRSRLLDLPEIAELVGPFDEAALIHPWTNVAPAVDELQRAVLRVVEQRQAAGESRRDIFHAVWNTVRHAHAEMPSPPATDDVLPPAAVPLMTEPWFC